MKTIRYISQFLTASLVLWQFIIPGLAQRSLDKARAMKENYDYVQAIALYNDQFKSSQPSIADARDLAQCYLMINDTRSTETWLQKVVASANHTAGDVLAYANVLKSEGKYGEAISQYQSYTDMVPSEKYKTDQQIASCRAAMDWIADPTYTDVLNVEKFNSENSEFGLMPFGNGFILTTDRVVKGINDKGNGIYGWTGNPYLKMYYTDGKESDQLSPLNAMNNEYHNGPGTYDTKNKIMYFTRTKMVKIKRKPVNSDPTSWYDHSPKAEEFTNRLEIYFAKNILGNWIGVQPFVYNHADEYSVGHPALSPDGNILYFVSDMPGGFGASDIYYCEKQNDGSWSKPKNAGSSINSAGKEVFPYVDKDGTLYFSSDGWAGMGGLDIFSSQGNRDQWSTPQNLKFPMNSSKDDFSICFTETGQAGYLSSNRDGGKGEDDIYSFAPAPPKNLIIVGLTRERLENNKFALLDKVSIKLSNVTGNTESAAISDDNGRFSKGIDCGASYEITATKEGYFAASKSLTTACKTRNDSVFVELDLDRIIINKPIVLENIYYDFDKWYIRPDAAIELDKLLKILVDNPGINIELGSHTDCRGTDAYNQNLSQKRAESAVAYIVSRGIDSKRITAKGYGESIPLNKCRDGVKCSDEDYQLNRRTEFKVTSLGNKP